MSMTKVNRNAELTLLYLYSCSELCLAASMLHRVRSVADSNHLFSTRINRISRSVPDASDSNQPDAGSGFEPHQFRATLVFTS